MQTFILISKGVFFPHLVYRAGHAEMDLKIPCENADITMKHC